MIPASGESEESGNAIGLASDGSTKFGGDERSNSTSSANKNNLASQERILSGHHDPRQRKTYLVLLSFTVLSAISGLALLFVWMFQFRPVNGIGIENAGQLANLHPLMMYTFMVSLNMYAVLVYRTHFNQPKQSLKWIHAILAGGNIVMSLLGVFAMFKSHLMAGIPNFYSLHSWIGAITNIFYLSQFVVGFVAFMKPGLAQHRRASIMPWHRFCGAALLVLAALAAITGITELVIFQDKNGAYSNFMPITFIANAAGLSVVAMTALSIYLLAAPQYIRPPLLEEAPLKAEFKKRADAAATTGLRD